MNDNEILETPLEGTEEEESTEETVEDTPTPVSKYLTVDERLLRASVTIENATSNTVIAAALETLGYDSDRLEEGRAMVDAAEVLANLQKVNYAHCTATKEVFHDIREEMISFYTANLSIAKVLFAGNDGISDFLELYGSRETSIAGQILQVTRFFTNAIADSDVVEAYIPHNIDLAMLEGGLTLADDTEKAYSDYKDAEGIAQETTQERDTALDDMEEWIKSMLVFAKIALADDPQLMESLLVLVRTPSPSSKDRQKTPPRVFDTPPFAIDDPDPGP